MKKIFCCLLLLLYVECVFSQDKIPTIDACELKTKVYFGDSYTSLCLINRVLQITKEYFQDFSRINFSDGNCKLINFDISIPNRNLCFDGNKPFKQKVAEFKQSILDGDTIVFSNFSIEIDSKLYKTNFILQYYIPKPKAVIWEPDFLGHDYNFFRLDTTILLVKKFDNSELYVFDNYLDVVCKSDFDFRCFSSQIKCDYRTDTTYFVDEYWVSYTNVQHKKDSMYVNSNDLNAIKQIIKSGIDFLDPIVFDKIYASNRKTGERILLDKYVVYLGELSKF